MTSDGSIRITPCGIIVIILSLLVAVYLSLGSAGHSWLTGESEHLSDHYQMISLKKLLTASVEMAKLGGHEVRHVRNQVNHG